MECVKKKRFISFSSGGTAGFAFIGCLRALEMLMGDSEYTLWIERLEGISGTSAGSLYGLMFALRLAPGQIDSITKSLDLRNCVSFTNIDQCHTKLGFSDMNEVRRYVHVILEEGGLSKNATMNDLRRFTGLTCIFRASNIITCRAENISHTTHTTMRIDDAICASCAIPLLYHPIHYKGELFVDGCLTGSVADVFDHDATLFLTIETPPPRSGQVSLIDYISSLFSFSANQACRVSRDDMFVLRLRNTSSFDTHASQTEIERDGFIASLNMFTNMDLIQTCGQLCRSYSSNVWEFTEDEEVPPEVIAPLSEDDRSEPKDQ